MKLRELLAVLGTSTTIAACGADAPPPPSVATGAGAAGLATAGGAGGEHQAGGAPSLPSAASAGMAGVAVPGISNSDSGGSPATAGSADQMNSAGSSGATEPSGCPLPKAAVCLDFEGGSPLSGLKQDGDDIDVSRTEHAHGSASLHFGNLTQNKKATITTSALSGITSVLWGRFFLYMDAGAPNGHGALVNAFDQAGNWYELGFQFSSFHGNWHVPAGVPERYMNSKKKVPPKVWSCVEFLFDGSAAAETQIWSDGMPVDYTQKAGSPKIQTVAQFKSVTIGFMAYHGTSLSDYAGDAAPSTTQMYIDDVALARERIGCDL